MSPQIGCSASIEKTLPTGSGPRNRKELADPASAMVASGKGLLAMGESNLICNKRFEAVGIAPTEENRRVYRELISTTPGLATAISDAMLYDETIHQAKKDGTSFVRLLTNAGIVPGVKVDTGAKDLAGCPGEQITEGLDGVRERLAAYYQLGARFANWRAVIKIGQGIPIGPPEKAGIVTKWKWENRLWLVPRLGTRTWLGKANNGWADSVLITRHESSKGR